jgi:hypothetical protein
MHAVGAKVDIRGKGHRCQEYKGPVTQRYQQRDYLDKATQRRP